MHEMSVCLALIDQVERIASENGATRVDKIIVTVGPLSGIEGALLRRAFPLAASGTVASDAELEIEASGVVVRCTVCGKASGAAPNRLTCSHCGDFRTRVVAGDEMLLKRLELVTATKPPVRPPPRNESRRSP